MQPTIRLTRKELAERLRLKVNTLAHWAGAGIGPKFINVNGRTLYDIAEVQRWEAERTHGSTAEYDSPRAANIVAGAAAYNAQRSQQAQAQASATA